MAAPLRGAHIVLHDDLGPRTDMSAALHAQKGWEVFVARDLTNTVCDAKTPNLPELPTVDSITAWQLAASLADGAVLKMPEEASAFGRIGSTPQILGEWP